MLIIIISDFLGAFGECLYVNVFLCLFLFFFVFVLFYTSLFICFLEKDREKLWSGIGEEVRKFWKERKEGKP